MKKGYRPKGKRISENLTPPYGESSIKKEGKVTTIILRNGYSHNKKIKTNSIEKNKSER